MSWLGFSSLALLSAQVSLYKNLNFLIPFNLIINCEMTNLLSRTELLLFFKSCKWH